MLALLLLSLARSWIRWERAEDQIIKYVAIIALKPKEDPRAVHKRCPRSFLAMAREGSWLCTRQSREDQSGRVCPEEQGTTLPSLGRTWAIPRKCLGTTLGLFQGSTHDNKARVWPRQGQDLARSMLVDTRDINFDKIAGTRRIWI
ncbi:hypothetical protein Scep_021703 [Stephania cephalantha]|uniref:Uncharacterized protein n=1 Tax=Stephania cephalantha TaxID=152367 RepID=A0AAP0FEI6_9MAGN